MAIVMNFRFGSEHSHGRAQRIPAYLSGPDLSLYTLLNHAIMASASGKARLQRLLTEAGTMTATATAGASGRMQSLFRQVGRVRNSGFERLLDESLFQRLTGEIRADTF